MKGYSKGSQTRSGLLWEVERLLTEVEELPQVLLMENVIQVHSEGENMANFQKWIDFLSSLGYSSYWQNMEASQYGIPQHRNRTIMVSILGEYQYKFPKTVKLDKWVDEYLENGKVDEKYYLNNEKTDILLDKLEDKGIILTDRQADRQIVVDFSIDDPRRNRIANCITARYDSGISNRRAEGSCVCERVQRKEDGV